MQHFSKEEKLVFLIKGISLHKNEVFHLGFLQ